MLIARAPLRISFAGGGTDLEAYYARYGGMVVSAAINKYFYTIITKADSGDLQLISSDYHSIQHLSPDTDLIWDGNMALPKAILEYFGITRNLNIFIASEVPPGTGLGSSSAAAVTMIKALSTSCDRPMTKDSLAELAAFVEIQKLGMPIGKQDQYAAAFGGINTIYFQKSGVRVEPLSIASEVAATLERNLMLFFTGVSRESTSILREQKAASQRDSGETIESLHRIKALAVRVKATLEEGRLDDFGRLLHQSWLAKKKLASNVTNSYIDECYSLAMENGALGGKIIGAGGGGFLMVYCPPDHQPAVTRALNCRGLRRMHFGFDHTGAEVVLNVAS